jgi:hypothetical protein
MVQIVHSASALHMLSRDQPVRAQRRTEDAADAPRAWRVSGLPQAVDGGQLLRHRGER